LISRDSEGFYTRGTHQAGGYGTRVREDVALLPVWCSLMNFALKSCPAKLVETSEQKLPPNSGFYFFFNIGCSHPISSLQSAVKFKPPFFLFFSSTHFLSPLYLLLMHLLLFLTPFTHQPGQLLYQDAWGQTRTKRHCPCCWVSCLCPQRLGKSYPSLLQPSLEHTQHKPVSPRKLAVKSQQISHAKDNFSTAYRLALLGQLSAGTGKGQRASSKASACQIPDHFHSTAVPGFHTEKLATVFGGEFEDPFPELLGLKFPKE